MVLYTFVIKSIQKRITHHYSGILTPQKLMPLPDILIIEEDNKETNGFFLYRYTKNGEVAGDTWHVNLEDAKQQAVFEYTDCLANWSIEPEPVSDIDIYVKTLCALLKKN